MSLEEMDEDLGYFVLGCQLGAAVETALPIDVEHCSGSNPCARGRIGFTVVSTGRCTTPRHTGVTYSSG